MTKTFCDRCGCEFRPETAARSVRIAQARQFPRETVYPLNDICGKCAAEIHEFCRCDTGFRKDGKDVIG